MDLQNLVRRSRERGASSQLTPRLARSRGAAAAHEKQHETSLDYRRCLMLSTAAAAATAMAAGNSCPLTYADALQGARVALRHARTVAKAGDDGVVGFFWDFGGW